jgi:tetratricopeptide (TPR) repeat protein
MDPTTLNAQHFAAAQSLYQAQRLAEAEQLCRQILAQAPDHHESLHLLGAIAASCGHGAAGVELIQRAIALRGDLPIYHLNLGMLLQQRGELDAATQEFERVVQLEPGAAEAQNSLAVLYLLRGRLPDAAAAFERVLALQPARADAWCNLGIALQQQSLAQRAIAAFEQALTLRPDYAEAAYNLGLALHQQDRLDEAVPRLEQALSIRSDYAEAAELLGRVLHNLGVRLQDGGRPAESIRHHKRALALQPTQPMILFSLAIGRLATGDLRAGWRDYEARWQTPHFAAEPRRGAAPRWDGAAGSGGTILLWGEQGLGDTLHFCRYAPLVAQRGWRVLVEAPLPLVRLLQSLEGVTVVPTGTAEPAGIACYCPMLSLPLCFDTVLETIPAAIPYLKAAPGDIERWRRRFPLLWLKEPGVLTIGLCWSGNPGKDSAMVAAMNARRAIPLERLGPLFAVRNTRFVSLQKDRRPDDNPAGHALIDPMAEVEDFADTAALLDPLDLVITVDTAVAHLAGALGKPVWLLNRYDSCWRWLRDRTDSPWYPTLRQFRQAAPGAWDSVIEEVAAAVVERKEGGR